MSLRTPRRRRKSGGVAKAWLQERLQAVTDEAGLMRELRLFRRQMMVRIAWAQALSLVREEETLQQLSVLRRP